MAFEDNTTVSLSIQPELFNDSAYIIHYNIYNPNSVLYTGETSTFGVPLGFLKFSLHGVGITFLSLFGLVGNLLSFIVWSTGKMRNSSTSYYLRGLAVSDIICVTFAVPILTVPTWLVYNYNYPSGNSSTWLIYNKHIVQYSRLVWCPPIYAIAQTGFFGSIVFTMALTMDRYLAICRPLTTRKYNLCSARKAKVVSFLLVIVSVLFSLPRFFEYIPKEVSTQYDSLPGIFPVPSKMRVDYYYDLFYVHMSYVLFYFLGPTIFLAVLNIKLYLKIQESNKLRKEMAAQTKAKSFESSYILFGIVIVFITSQCVPATHATIRQLTGGVGTEDHYPEVVILMTFFVVVNSSVNFLIYCVSGRKFRRALLNLFRK